MEIRFNTTIINTIDDITSLTYSFIKPGSKYDVLFTKEITDKYFEKHVRRFTVHDSIFNECSCINITVNYNDNTVREFTYDNISDLIFKQPSPQPVDSWIKRLLRTNTNTVYDDNNTDKTKIFKILKLKFNAAEDLDKSIKGSKNLIYYSVGGDTGFLDTLKLSVTSLLANGGNGFDLLFICPQSWTSNITAMMLELQTNVDYSFHIVDDTDDGIQVALNRFNIFDFSNIDEYSNVMYLDADIIINDDINSLFNVSVNDKLNTAYNENITKSWLNLYTSLKWLPAGDPFLSNSLSSVGFNSGQYVFKNTDSMKQHFTNLRWLVSVWPGEYFTDQAFMCTYFTFFGLCVPSLQPFVNLYNFGNKLTQPDSNKTLIHFIGWCQRPEAKLLAMQQYANL